MLPIWSNLSKDLFFFFFGHFFPLFSCSYFYIVISHIFEPWFLDEATITFY